MASFFRRLFGGGGESQPAPVGPPPVVNTPEAKKKATEAHLDIYNLSKRATKTKFTGPLGLSNDERSQRALKYLTGQ